MPLCCGEKKDAAEMSLIWNQRGGRGDIVKEVVMPSNIKGLHMAMKPNLGIRDASNARHNASCPAM